MRPSSESATPVLTKSERRARLKWKRLPGGGASSICLPAQPEFPTAAIDGLDSYSLILNLFDPGPHPLLESGFQFCLIALGLEVFNSFAGLV